MWNWKPAAHRSEDVEVYAKMNLEEFVPHPKGYRGDVVPVDTGEEDLSVPPFGWRDERGVGVVEIITNKL